jgi:hypothetical protein
MYKTITVSIPDDIGAVLENYLNNSLNDDEAEKLAFDIGVATLLQLSEFENQFTNEIPF